ncbi:helix-turn-helix domain-containing protein [Chryseobacterium sp. RP-3-3]|uniref:Helix-turn-helix domain-containing protein n=1 Tax=Chryseobacterium antibioticum TaxID=2728847 RepID=A0A7Y0ARH9_9FLAO|nr:helix-turn-helix domain-containing protein [Chryseobacterium antibioticum]NML72191.1 helix-turn-helix domain-containing protein [Chryseobacterium antibioticum]
MEKSKPDYKRIYSDIINKKYPHKKKECQSILEKDNLSFLDVMKMNTLIFGVKSKEAELFNGKHRAYNKSTILDILHYQEENRLNNTQLAIHFQLSRNSVAKWKKIFAVKFCN